MLQHISQEVQPQAYRVQAQALLESRKLQILGFKTTQATLVATSTTLEDLQTPDLLRAQARPSIWKPQLKIVKVALKGHIRPI